MTITLTEIKTCTRTGCNEPRVNGRYLCRTHRNEDAANWRAENPDRHRANWFKAKYGITQDEYDALLKQQNGVCAICLSPQMTVRQGKTIMLCIDHDHETDEVRGLLCSKCNVALGQMDDSPALLRQAAEYLETSRR